MRKFVFLIMLLLCLNYVYASSKAYATIEIKVINRAPEISSLAFVPNEAYYDSTLECLPVIKDETPDTVKVDYMWYKNGILMENEGNKFSGFEDNDEITCEAIPIDSYGLKGEMKSVKTKILQSNIQVRILKPMLNTAGIGVNAKELQENTNIGAITGMVTGKNTGANSGLTLLFLLVLFAILLTGINIFGVLMHYSKKKKQSF
jgi:hypothetical protein